MALIAQTLARFVGNVRHGFKSLIPITTLIIYTLIGALVFKAIEGPNEVVRMGELKKQRERIITETAYRLNSVKTMTPLQAYNHTVATLIHYGDQLGVDRLNTTKWDFWAAVYYSMTIYTTIGYGNIHPMTNLGRLITVVYAFIGIPLALIALIVLGGLFARACIVLWRVLVRSMGCFSKRLERKMTSLGVDLENANNQVEEPEAGADEALLHFPIWFLIMITVIWVCICAYVFTLWEDSWSYGLSLYFVIISFLTIGFGDIIPSNSNYIILVGAMVLLGLALVSTVLQIMQKQLHALADDVKGRIDKDYRAALEEVESDEQGPTSAGAATKSKSGPSLDAVIARMPVSSRLLYHLMPATERKRLTRHVNKRKNLASKGVQTEPMG